MSVVMMPRAAAPRVLGLCAWVVALAVGVLAAPNEARSYGLIEKAATLTGRLRRGGDSFETVGARDRDVDAGAARKLGP